MQSTYSLELINETRIYIKIYIDCLASWNHYVTLPSKKSIWIFTYSMLNLLDLPSMMETFGPLKNYWEGSKIVEGILKRVKVSYSRMYPNWFMTLTKNQYRCVPYPEYLPKYDILKETQF